MRSKLRDETLRADREQQQRSAPASCQPAPVTSPPTPLLTEPSSQLEGVMSPPALAPALPSTAPLSQPKVYPRGTLLYGVVRGQHLNAHPSRQWPDDREVVAVKSFDPVYGNYFLLAEDATGIPGAAIVELICSKTTVVRNMRETTQEEAQRERWCRPDLPHQLQTAAMETQMAARPTPNLGPRKRTRP